MPSKSAAMTGRVLVRDSGPNRLARDEARNQTATRLGVGPADCGQDSKEGTAD